MFIIKDTNMYTKIIKNKNLLTLSFIFFIIFFYDLDYGITDYFFLIISIFFFISSILFPKWLSDYIFIIAFTSYSFLLCYSIFFTPTVSNNDIFMQDDVLGYKLIPNLIYKFDDNLRKGLIKTNSLGFRDDEFIDNGKNNIVLLGDSMTFGSLVDQKDNLDKQIEASCKNINAHNLGVGNYGLPTIISNYKSYNIKHSHVVYFFYINDLRIDNFNNQINTIVKDGYIIEKKGSDGTVISEDEINIKMNEFKKKKENIYGAIKLRYFFMLLKDYLVMNGVFSTSHELNDFKYGGYSDELTDKAVFLTNKLREIVNSRGSEFTVVILPSHRSINGKKYTHQVKNYIEKISYNLRTIDLLDDMNQGDLIYYDGHLSEKGMQKIAKKLCASISGRY